MNTVSVTDRVAILVAAAIAAGQSEGASTSPPTDLLALLRMRRDSLHASAEGYLHSIELRLRAVGRTYAGAGHSARALVRDLDKLAKIQAGIELLEAEAKVNPPRPRCGKPADHHGTCGLIPGHVGYCLSL